MRKNFLLLFLLALLPMAGWAANVDVTVTCHPTTKVYGVANGTLSIANSGNWTVTFSRTYGSGTISSTVQEELLDLIRINADYQNTNVAGTHNWNVTLKNSSLSQVSSGGDNYRLSTNAARMVQATLTVTKAPNEITALSLADWVLGGTVSTPSITATSTAGTISYQYSKNKEDWTNGYNPGAQGHYYLRATIAESANYQAVTSTQEVKFTVKGKAEPSGVSLSAKTYTGEAQSLIKGTEGFPDDYEQGVGGYEYIVKDVPSTPAYDATATGATAINAGEYFVYARVKADGDLYVDGDWKQVGTTGVKISRATITDIADWSAFITAPAAVTDELTYNEEAQNLITPAVIKDADAFKNATITYKVDDGSYGATYSATDAKDPHKVTYQITGADNFNDFTSAAIEKTIKKFTPVRTTDGGVNTGVIYQKGTAQDLIAIAPDYSGPKNTSVAGEYTFKWTDGTDKTATVAGDVEATNVAEYPIKYTFKPTDLTNYEEITSDQTLGTATIVPATYVFDAAPAAVATELTYKGADQKLLAQGFTLKTTEDAGTPSFTWYRKADKSDAQTTDDWEEVVGLHAGTYTVEWTYTAADPNTDNWNVASGKIENIKINQVGLIISGATVEENYDPAKVYNKSDLFVYDEDAFVTTEDKNKAVTIITDLVNFELTKGADKINVFPTTAPVNAGVWTIGLSKISDPDVEDYNIKNLQPGQLTIKKVDPAAPATVAPEFATATELIYTSDPLDLVKTPGTSTEGTWKYRLEGAASTAIPQGTDAKEYTVYYKFEGDDNHNDIAEASQVVKINPATPVVTVAIDDWTYGETAKTPTADADFKSEGEPTITYAKASAPTEFGTYEAIVNDQAGDYIVKASVAKADNWNAAEKTANFTIARATLEIDVDDNGKTYGAADPKPLTYSATGFGWDDDATTIDLKAVRAAGETVGTYDIDAEWDADKAKNYDVKVNTKGTFTISAATLTIAVADAGKVYGAAEPTSFEYTATSFQNGDKPETIGLTVARVAGENVGTYDIEATWNPALATNYTVSATKGTFTITEAALTLKAKALTKEYGEDDPVLVLAEDPDYKNGDDATSIGLTITRAKGEDVGTYVITPAATSKNYTYKIETADFEITPATLVYTLGNVEYPYTGKAYEPVEGETFAKTDGKFFFDDAYGTTFEFTWPDKAVVKDAKEYTFNQLETKWKVENHNYYIIFSKDAVVTVNPAEIDFTDAEAFGGLTYTGEAQTLIKNPATATFTDFEENVTNFKVEYSLDNATWNEELPKATDAGDYKVYTKVTANDNFVAVEPEVIEVSIAPATWTLAVAEIEALEALEKITFDNTDKFKLPEVLTVKNGETALVNEKDYEWAVTFKKNAEAEAATAVNYINAGIYTFTFTGIGNYADKANVNTYELTIQKADIEVEAPVANMGDKGTGLEYEKTEFTLVAPAVATVAATDAFIPVVLYSLEDTESSYKADLPKAMNAGDYNVYYKVKGDDNHNDFVAEAPVAVNIAKAELIATAASATKTYDGTTDIENNEFGDFSYSGLLGGDHVDLGDAQISEFVKLTLGDNENGIDVGTYTLTIKDVDAFPKQDNYYVGSALPGTLTIEPAAPVTIAFTAAAKYGKEYAAADNLNVVAGDLMASPETGWFDKFADIADQLTISREEGEDVGTYDVMLALGEKATFQNNYENVIFAVGADKFEITPYATELKVSIASFARSYNDEVAAYAWAEDLSNMVVTNLPAGKDKSDIFGENPDNLPKVTVVDAGKNVGEYSIELTGGVSKNYKVKLLPGSYYTIEPVAVKAVFNSIPVAAAGVKVSDMLGDVVWTVEAVDEADGTTLNAKMGLFKLTYAGDVETTNEVDYIADTEDGVGALVITYNPVDAAEADNFAWYKDSNIADLNIGGEGGSIALDDSGEIITYASENSTVTFTQSRAVTKNVWQSCVLPFDVTPAQFSDVFGYAAIDVFDESRTNDKEVHFCLKVTGTIEAGTPFLFKTDNDRNFDGTAKDGEGNPLTVKFEGVNLVNTEGLPTTVEDDDTDIQFIGTFTGENITTAGYRYLSKGTWYATQNGMSKPYVIKPLRAFLNMGSYAPARIVIEEPDGTTSIMDVNSFNDMLNVDGWYTIEGKKLNAAPTQKGVYIQNGKKVVIK